MTSRSSGQSPTQLKDPTDEVVRRAIERLRAVLPSEKIEALEALVAAGTIFDATVVAAALGRADASETF